MSACVQCGERAQFVGTLCQDSALLCSSECARSHFVDAHNVQLVDAGFDDLPDETVFKIVTDVGSGAALRALALTSRRLAAIVADPRTMAAMLNKLSFSEIVRGATTLLRRPHDALLERVFGALVTGLAAAHTWPRDSDTLEALAQAQAAATAKGYTAAALQLTQSMLDAAVIAHFTAVWHPPGVRFGLPPPFTLATDIMPLYRRTSLAGRERFIVLAIRTALYLSHNMPFALECIAQHLTTAERVLEVAVNIHLSPALNLGPLPRESLTQLMAPPYNAKPTTEVVNTAVLFESGAVIVLLLSGVSDTDTRAALVNGKNFSDAVEILATAEDGAPVDLERLLVVAALMMDAAFVPERNHVAMLALRDFLVQSLAGAAPADREITALNHLRELPAVKRFYAANGGAWPSQV